MVKKSRKSGTELVTPIAKVAKLSPPGKLKAESKTKSKNGSHETPKKLKEIQSPLLKSGKKVESKGSLEVKANKSAVVKASEATMPNQKSKVDTSSLVEEAKLKQFVSGLYELHSKTSKDPENGAGKKLFETDESECINLMVASIKLPADGRKHVLKIELPHTCLPDPTDVCLIVKDLEKGLKVDHEPTTNHFKSMLADKGIDSSLISMVMPLRELKVEYKAFEAKTALCHKFDLFLVDDRIAKFVPKFLGKAFYKRKKFPRSIDLTSKKLREEINSAMHTVTLPLSHHGPSAMVQVGHMGMAKDQVEANLKKVFDVLKIRFPGGWKNIRSLHIKTARSMAIPIYVSETPINDVGYVDASLPLKKKVDPITDEVSTQPNLKVTITPGGNVKVKHVPDPVWQEICQGGGGLEEEDGEESDDDEDKKVVTKKVEKKSKKEEKKKKEKQAGKAQKDSLKGKKLDQAKRDEDSSDDDMEEVEQVYLKQKSADDKTEDPDESEESFDDDQEVDADDIIRDDDDGSSDDDNEELVLQPTVHGDDDESEEEVKTPGRKKLSKKDRKLAAKEKGKKVTPGHKNQSHSIKKKKK